MSKPEYTAWNKEKAQAEKKEYPPVAIALAIILPLASVVPIVVVAILRALKISRPDPTDYKVPMSRVDTNASTLPMFPNEYHDNMDDKSEQSSDSDGGIHCTDNAMDNNSRRNDTNDMKNVNEINTVSNENVGNLIDAWFINR